MRKFFEYVTTGIAMGVAFITIPFFEWRCKNEHHMWKQSPVEENQEYCIMCWNVQDKEDS